MRKLGLRETAGAQRNSALFFAFSPTPVGSRGVVDFNCGIVQRLHIRESSVFRTDALGSFSGDMEMRVTERVAGC